MSLLFAQFSHCIGLNDVCDGLRLNSGLLSTIRGATPPSRNTLSYANKERDAGMAQKLFWCMMDHLHQISPEFGQVNHARGLVRRFRRSIDIVDSTTIQLIARCIDWAKHRRRKAAAKCHLRLNLQSLLPRFAMVDTAREHDAKRAREVCAGISEGEIVIFDKAYLDFDHLRDLGLRGIFWVTRAKENLLYRVTKRLPKHSHPKILRDELIQLKGPLSGKEHPQTMRRIVALVMVNKEEREMVFLTNHLEWSPATVTDLYRCRWEIEVFFKQMKQTLQIADFLGNNANAVRWQVWMALLVCLLLKYQAFLSRWNQSFTRLFTLLRAALWKKLNLLDLLKSYGTASGSFRFLAAPQQAFLPGFT